MTAPVAYWHVPDIEAKLTEADRRGRHREGACARRRGPAAWWPPSPTPTATSSGCFRTRDRVLRYMPSLDSTVMSVLKARSSSSLVTRSPAVWASSGSPGPSSRPGMPLSAKEVTSVQPNLARGGCPLAFRSADRCGWSRAGDAAGLKSTTEIWSPTASCSTGRSHALSPGFGGGHVAVRSEAVVDRQRRPVWNDVPRHPAAHVHRLDGFAVAASVDDRFPGPVRPQPFQEGGRADGWRLFPSRGGRCGPGRPSARPPTLPLPGIRPRCVSRSARPSTARRRPRADRGGRRCDLEQAVVLPGDLLAGIEDIGEVDRGACPALRPAASITARPPFMSALPSPQRVSPSTRSAGRCR